MRRRRIVIPVVVGAVILLVGVIWMARRTHNAFFYPEPPAAHPPVVDKSTEPLLADLDAVLPDKAPAVAAALQAGLTDAEIDSLER